MKSVQVQVDIPDGEIWKIIPSFPSYEASNRGRVRSLHSRRGILRKRPLMLKQFYCRKYRRVCVCVGGKSYQRGVHRLVIEAFRGPSYMQCNHIDGNPENNRLENLEYCDAFRNMRHASSLGLRPDCRGEKIVNKRRWAHIA